MAFERDLGTCCACLPLKFGVGIIAMLIFMSGVLSVVALFTGEVIFQPNGYNSKFYNIPNLVGIPGLIFGFVGLMGVYDDQGGLIRAFNYYFMVKFVASLATIGADFYTLSKCDTWMSNSNLVALNNQQMQQLSQMGVCPWARWSYGVGCSLDVLFWGYCLYKSLGYMWHLDLNPAYPIDFGSERFDVEGRWKFYQVKDPK